MKNMWIIAALIALFTGRAFGQCSDYQLSITGACPGTVTVFWGGAPPASTQGLIIANTLGSFTLPPGPCVGTLICIQGAVALVPPTFSTGPAGVGSVSGAVGAGACGRYLIAVTAGAACKVSNPVQIPLQHRDGYRQASGCSPIPGTRVGSLSGSIRRT